MPTILGATRDGLQEVSKVKHLLTHVPAWLFIVSANSRHKYALIVLRLSVVGKQQSVVANGCQSIIREHMVLSRLFFSQLSSSGVGIAFPYSYSVHSRLESQMLSSGAYVFLFFVTLALAVL
jgi:hypothetical protein